MKKITAVLCIILCAVLLIGCVNNNDKIPQPTDEELENTKEIGAGNILHVTEEEPEPEPEPEPLTPYDTVLKLSGAKEFPEPGLFTAPQAFVYDINKGQLLYIKGQGEKLYPASVTKLLTILVAADFLDPTDIIKIGNEVTSSRLNTWVNNDYAVAWMVEGMEVTAEQAAEGMLLVSGSDAAYTLGAAAARAYSGDNALDGDTALATNVQMMNDYAVALGMAGSHFANVDGHSDENHYSTVEDMALLAVKAYGNPTVRKYCGVVTDSVKFADQPAVSWVNSNKLLNPNSSWYCPYVKGMKTGSLTGCNNLIVLAEKNGQAYIIGVFSEATEEARYESSLALVRSLLGPWETAG